ncbi:MAG: AmmeMemoRadiSam system protein B [Candidatus Woesearchaeota archaeon]
MRYSAYSDILYNKSFDDLDKQIKECFYTDLGPGDLPSKRENRKVFGIISPNSEYKYSGACAAWAFKELAESEFQDTYIILGTDKNNTSCYISTEDWETPLGKVQIDKELANVLMSNLNFIKENNDIHKDKHEIEVQLPFLQFVSKDKLHELKILPITIGKITIEQMKEFADLLESLDRQICVIASTNLTRKEESNKKIIAAIKEMDSKEVLAALDEERQSIDSINSILTCIEISKSFGSKWARLLREYHSSKVKKDFNSATGYAAISFE